MNNNLIQMTIRLVKGSQKARILWHLDKTPLRFNELLKALTPVSKKVLSEQLKELENDGFISRIVYPETPVRVEYSINELGKTIKPLFEAIEQWQKHYRKYYSQNIRNKNLLVEDYSSNLILDIIGNKWNDRIVYTLNHKTKRFGQLKKELEPISQKILTEHLRELENYGIIKRTVYNEVPPKVEYSLTELGQSLIHIIHMLYEWGYKYQN